MGFWRRQRVIRVFRIDEPELFFGGNRKCLDPQVGLLNFGPHGGMGVDPQRKISIIAGIIGTDQSIDTTRVWLSRLRHRIAAEERPKTEYKGIDFPGMSLDSPLRFEILVDKNCIVKIDKKFVKNLRNVESRKDRILLAVREYCKKLDDLTEAHPLPQIVLLPIDSSLLRLCKEPYRRTDKIIYQRRVFGDQDSTDAELFDFHNYLKAQAALRNLVTQMITPKTLVFAEEQQSPAIIGWNVSVGMYYKATGIPWKLAEIEEDTCYVGVSFYNEIGQRGKSVRASIAQVYMRTGESQVIRGRPFEWDEEERGRTVYLNSSQMGEIIQDSIDLFLRQRNELPRRLVVHKSTRFSDDEIDGCEQASENIDELDIVHIRDWTGFRAYHLKHDYPIVRGNVIANSDEAILFTTGYVPALGTYPGPSAPRPLHLICQRIDTSIESICRDMLGLTKLDWNSSTFYTRMPVTIGVSRKVGAVMAEMVSAGVTPPSSYRFYM